MYGVITTVPASVEMYEEIHRRVGATVDGLLVHVGHPRCSVVAVAAACSSSSTSGARLSHLSHVVCVGRSTRRSEV